MTSARQVEIQALIDKKQRRLQKLKEKEATLGINTPPEILTEMEDIELEIERLREEWRQVKDSDPPDNIEESPGGTTKSDGQSPIELLVAKIGVMGTIVAALIGLIGIGITAYFGYLGIQAQIELPIQATQTAEAKAILLALSVTPTPQSTEMATPTTGPAPTDTPTVTPTRQAPPTFISEYVFDPEWDAEQVEFDFEPGIVPTETITDFIKLSRVALGSTENAKLAMNVRLRLKNTGTRPLILDLNQRFFSLEDEQGRKAELLYFCCDSQGELLGPGQEREVQLIFRGDPGWIGKEVSTNAIFVRVRGLLPVVRASWRIHTLATAE
ncbi:MAG: hypothetical protein KDI79_13300 [Anaerolineae bacterium]|nr:hypothetical protein [Anaerolineae bacterium]